MDPSRHGPDQLTSLPGCGHPEFINSTSQILYVHSRDSLPFLLASAHRFSIGLRSRLLEKWQKYWLTMTWNHISWPNCTSWRELCKINVCLYLNVSFVILYMLSYKGPRGRQQLLSWSLNFSRQSLVCFAFLWADNIKSGLCCLVGSHLGYMTRYL